MVLEMKKHDFENTQRKIWSFQYIPGFLLRKFKLKYHFFATILGEWE